MQKKFSNLYTLSETLTVLSNLKNDVVVSNLCNLLNTLSQKDVKDRIYPEAIKYYTTMCNALYKADKTSSLPNYLYDLILYDENCFSDRCSHNKYHEISSHIIEAVKNDIKTIRLLSEITCEEINGQIVKNNPKLEQMQDSLPTFSSNFKHTGAKDIWENYIADFVRFYKKNGMGQFAKNHSFRVDLDGNIVPVTHPDKIQIDDLKLYDGQKQKANDNLIAFMANNPYNNVLLYGDRGTGKSSCVKALANEYAEMGLRIIQIEKSNLKHLSNLLETLADNSLKFLIFIDDLTFNEDDENMNTLKAVLEGSLFVQPANTIIYATSNRRHIVKETFTAREGDEIHKEDTIDELMSLSDRFGLVITYQMPSKENYLEITRQIAKDRGINAPIDEIISGAERFALSKGYRSPRIARQYLDLAYSK
ncbi:MAG: ATP-binding protein [Candidatus Gastranaerophilales bacterium]|nr:ATP-binding protein [Candidatus Gastranaerophilales bacterium]